ncbi:MAG: FtsH protease activity modulator HflK [Alphaproteobacteria bacterium]|nr:FtsH protease activity modulator HflK [Alphaproteobacteria bacterium]
MTPPNDNDSPWGNASKRPPSGGGSGGNNNPWAGPPGGGGGGKRGENEYDAVKRILKGVSQDFMGGNIGGGKIFAIMGIIVLVLWGFSGIFQVSASQLAIVLRFGEVQQIVGPGLRYHLPYPLEDVILKDVTTARREPVGYTPADDYNRRAATDDNNSMMLTSDENLVDVNFDVIWQVDPTRLKDFVFNIAEPQLTVKAVAETAMREVIGQSNIQTAITSGRDKIEQKTLELVQKTLDQYQAGIMVTQINLRNSMPPQEVADAFQDVTRARSDKETRINEADTYRNKIIPDAEGQSSKMLQEAGAYKEQIVNQANGNAQRFLSVYQSYQNARDVTARQMYLETMEHILKDANKVVVDPNIKGIAGYLPLNGIGKNVPRKED